MSPWKVILATMVIFACGIFTGVFVSRMEPISPISSISQTAPSVPSPVTTNSTSTNKPPLPVYAQLQVQRPEFLKRLDRQLET